jgi:hypothetical protein
MAEDHMLKTTLYLATAAILLLALIGCSSDFVTASRPQQDSTNSQVEYFPLEQGFVTSYQIVASNGSSVSATFEVGGESSIKGSPVTIWIASSSGGRDTSYFANASDGLYFYESINSNSEKILEYPVQLGSSWDRFNSGTKLGNDDPYVDVLTDNKLIADTTSPNPDTLTGTITTKNYPTEGSSIMSVEGLESVSLSSGTQYAQSLHVSNDGLSGTKNHYWYAPGIGLVKFVIGASDVDATNGAFVGELVTYFNR